jgi:hypothetical protein
MAHKIIIEVDENSQTALITEYDGETPGPTRFYESVAVFAGDARNQDLFVKMYGAGADAAWALGETFRASREEGASKGVKNFFKQLVARICIILDPDAFRQEANALEVINKWEDQDQSRWFGQDSEDVLDDKQQSEGVAAARKRWEEIYETSKIKKLGPEAIVSGKEEAPNDPKKWN